MITYNWNCETVDAYVQAEGNDDVVYNVHWTLIGVSDTLNSSGLPYTANTMGTQTLDISNITNFIPWNAVTETLVEGWTKAAMGEEQVDSMEALVKGLIDLEIAPVTIQLKVGQPIPE